MEKIEKKKLCGNMSNTNPSGNQVGPGVTLGPWTFDVLPSRNT